MVQELRVYWSCRGHWFLAPMLSRHTSTRVHTHNTHYLQNKYLGENISGPGRQLVQEVAGHLT